MSARTNLAHRTGGGKQKGHRTTPGRIVEQIERPDGVVETHTHSTVAPLPRHSFRPGASQAIKALPHPDKVAREKRLEAAAFEKLRWVKDVGKPKPASRPHRPIVVPELRDELREQALERRKTGGWGYGLLQKLAGPGALVPAPLPKAHQRGGGRGR